MDLFQQAEAAEQMGQFENAVGFWEELCNKKPTAQILCRLGLARREIDQWELAEEAFLAALAIEKDFRAAMMQLGFLNMDRQDTDHEVSMDHAATWFRRSIAIEPSAPAYNCLGVVLHHKDDIASARRAYERAIEIDENFEEAYYNLGQLEDTNLEDAHQIYEKAIELDPDYAAAHQAIGIVEHKMKNFPAAEYHFRKAVELKPLDIFSHLYLANLLAVVGDSPAAEAEFRAAIAVDPEQITEAIEFFARFLDGEEREEEATRIRQSRTSS